MLVFQQQSSSFWRGGVEKPKHSRVPCPHTQTTLKSRTRHLDVWEFIRNISGRCHTAGLRCQAVQPSSAWKPYGYTQSPARLCTAGIQSQTTSLQWTQRSGSQVQRWISQRVQTWELRHCFWCLGHKAQPAQQLTPEPSSASLIPAWPELPLHQVLGAPWPRAPCPTVNPPAPRAGGSTRGTLRSWPGKPPKNR